VLCMEFELSAGGVAGADDDESVGALGDVDCCLEHATRANALRHNKRRLRFMESPHCMSGTKRPRLGASSLRRRVDLNALSQVVFHAAVDFEGRAQDLVRLGRRHGYRSRPAMLQGGAQ